MVRFREFEAWLQHDDIPIREFATQQTDNVVSCYVPYNAKIPFQVHWSDHGSKLFTAGYIVVDGVKSSGRYLRGEGQTNRQGYRTGPITEEPYTFTTDHGTVELRIALVESGALVSSSRPEEVIAMRDQAFSNQGLSYRSIPGLERFTVPEQYGTTIAVSTHPHQPAKTCVTFIWHYRTPRWLEEKGMLKLTPNPLPLPISVCNTREFPSQHEQDWPTSYWDVPPVVFKPPITDAEGIERAGQLREKYKPYLEEEMKRRYGYEHYDIDDPNFKVPKMKYKTRKSREGKGKEKETEKKKRKGKGKEKEIPDPPPAQDRAGPSREVNNQPAQGPSDETRKAEKRTLGEPMDAGELKDMYKNEFEAEMVKRYGPNWSNPKVTKRLDIQNRPKRAYSTQSLSQKQKQKPGVQSQEDLAKKQTSSQQSKPDSLPPNIQKHPRASNTYILPSPAPSSSSSSSTPRVASLSRSSPSVDRSMPPPPFPYLTPSGRPSAIIDTRFFGYASPAPSEASSSTSAHPRSGQTAR